MKKLIEHLRNIYAPKTDAPEYQPLVMDLILHKNKPITRLQRREYVMEYKKVIDQIKPLEDQYLNDLFNDNLQADAYTYYLNTFTFKAKLLNKGFKYIKINEYYFSELYHK